MFNSPLKERATSAAKAVDVNNRKGDTAAAAVPVLQNKMVQKVATEEEEPVQGKFADGQQNNAVFQKKENNTGLPGDLKNGVESLSGFAMDDVKVHYNSDKPAQLNALAYAEGTNIHIGAGQEKHLPHEAWHVVQQKQGRVKPMLQMKKGVAVNDDKGLENEADIMGAAALQYKADSFATGQKPHESNTAGSVVVQRWQIPQEDQEAGEKLDQLEQINVDLANLRLLILTLKNAIPVKMRAFWDTDFLAVTRANDLKASIDTKLRIANPQTSTLVNLTDDVAESARAFAALQADFNRFDAWYTLNEPKITERIDLHDEILRHPAAAAKSAEWRAVALAVKDMNTGNIPALLATFNATTAVGEAVVEAARLPAASAAEKQAVVDLLKNLFSTGLARLDTWAKSYPTSYDLKTGEFGAEWHVKSSYFPWLNGKWVFHAHCETTRNADGGHDGFRFKDILGTNHLKMTEEKMMGGVQLDLALSRADLDNMAAPYQAAFFDRLSNDSVFKSILKKAKR